MVTKEKSRGSVLVMVLIFCLVLGLIAKTSLETSGLQFKMLHNYKIHQQSKKDVDNALKKLEHRLEKSIDNLPDNISFLQFVPDSLAFGETQGALFYGLNVKKVGQDDAPFEITTSFCVRKTKEEVNLTYASPDALATLREQLNALRIIEAIDIVLKTGEHVYVVAYQARDNVNTIALIEKFGGRLIKEFKLEVGLSSAMLAVDSSQQGYVDIIYLGNIKGELLALDLHSTLSEQWEMKRFRDLFSGYIVGKPVASAHPQSKGIILYVLVADAKKQYALIGLEQTPKETVTFFQSRTFAQLGQPLLWQGYLLVGADNQLLIFDANTAKETAVYALQTTAQFSLAQEAFLPPQVFITQPLDPNPSVVIRTNFKNKQCFAPILSTPLGRKTWTRNLA